MNLMQKIQIQLVVILGVLILLLASYYVFFTPSIPENPPTLTVVTYNVHQGLDAYGWNNFAAVAKVIKALNADIVGLQESDTARVTSANQDIVHYLAEKLNYYAYYGPPTSEQTFGVALLSRFPLKNAQYHLLESPTEQRVLLTAEITVNNTKITIGVAHIGLTVEERTIQTKEILSIMQKINTPKILLGDFNYLPNSTVVPLVLQEFQDAYLTAHNTTTHVLTWSSTKPQEPNDRIFLSKHFIVLDSDIYQSTASDHFPLYAFIKLRS